MIGALAIGMLSITGGSAFAQSSYLNSFNTTYGTAGTVLNTCTLCHPNYPNSFARNNFGSDYASSQIGNHSFNAALENRDSDLDGATNIEEINARTFPGNASSTPPPQPPPNQSPSAGNDSYSVDAGATLGVTPPGVLGNDSDPDSDPITAVLVSGPSSGTFNLSSNGSFTYTPTISSGQVTFTYRANDGTANSNVATVTITVNAVTPPNQPPSAGNDSYSVDAGATLGVTPPGVLGNDSDPDSDPITAVLASGPSSGTFNLSSNGSFTYTPTISSGQVTFTYRANDGTANSNVATVTITVNAVTAGNTSPTANAGPDQTVTAGSGGTASVTLNGSGSSDPDAGDSISSYSWSGPFGTATGANPSVTLGEGTHTITLTVQDTHGASDTDTVVVTVNAATPSNNPPTANAGPDQAVVADSSGTASVTLDGSGSRDPDAGDSISSYSWSGPFGTATGMSPPVTLGVGVHTITLTVQDTHGASDTDTVQVTVDSETPPPPPSTGDLSMSPENGAVDITVTTAIMITTNGSAAARSIAEPSDIATIVNNDTFRLMEGSAVATTSAYERDHDDDEHTRCVSNGVVNGTIAYDELHTTATFTPDCPLKHGTTYTATITPLAGTQSALAETLTWSFTTIAGTPDTDNDGVEDGEDELPDDDTEATPPKSKGEGKFHYRLRRHERAYLRKVRGISDTHYTINQTGKPVGYDFPDGLVVAEIHDVVPGETVDVELTFPEAVPEGSKAYMAEADGFREVPAVISGDTVTLTLSGADVGNGNVPPVGVAVPTATEGGSVDLSTGAAGGGCSVAGAGGGWKEAVGSYGLLVLVWLGLALRRRNPETGR